MPKFDQMLFDQKKKQNPVLGALPLDYTCFTAFINKEALTLLISTVSFGQMPFCRKAFGQQRQKRKRDIMPKFDQMLFGQKKQNPVLGAAICLAIRLYLFYSVYK